MSNREFYIKLMQNIDAGEITAVIADNNESQPQLYATRSAPQEALRNSLTAEEAWELIRLPNRVIPVQ